MLCAGITSISFKYSHLIYKIKKIIVTILKQRSQSAGNFIFFNFNFFKVENKSISETLRNKSVIKKISVHIPTHLKPINNNEFGHYLAGLIDGDGHFSNQLQLIIAFNEKDASLAYYIKGRIGYGNVYKVKNKKAIILVISNQFGLVTILELINGKLRTENKFNQINKNVLSNSKIKLSSDFYKNTDNDLNNHWLAGFSDADASFQIKIISRNNKTEVRLNFQIDQKKDDLLMLIKNYFGGNIGYRKSQDSYYYGSTSFGSAKKIIKYFDHFHLLSSKHVNYLKWRKSYIIIQNKEHLLNSGLAKIIKLKKTMNRKSSQVEENNNTD